ncbi:MAG: LPS export ABC transporter permease LptF [Burkholderiales bacterium]
MVACAVRTSIIPIHLSSRTMLFDSSLRRELARSFGGTLVIMLTIVLTMMLIRTLALAAGGRVSPQDVALLLGYTALGQMPSILALSLFVAVVSTLTRMYRDSEMAIWLCSGVSLMRLLPVVLRFALPVVALLAVLALVVWPWTNRQAVDLRERYEARSDLSRVAPGQFQTSGNGQRVFFIDKDAVATSTGTGSAGHIFILDQQPQRESVTTATSGRIEPTSEGARQLVLGNGARTDLDAKTGDKSLARFDEYRITVGEKAVTQLDELPPKARNTLDLLRMGTAKARAELAWRTGLALTACNLLLLGIGLAAGNPRRANTWTLLLALLAFVVYFNLLNLSQAWVGAGRVPLAAALVGLHGTVFLLGVALLWWRHTGSARHTLRLWPVPRTSAA